MRLVKIGRYAFVALIVLIAGIGFAATFGISSATWNISTLKWKIAGTGELSAKTNVSNTYTGDYYGTLTGNATTGAWSQTNAASEPSLVPCELYARQGFITLRKNVSSSPSVCLGSTSGQYYGLISAYSFDEPSGTTSYDYSGTNNATLISGATRDLSGKNSLGISFDGTSGRLEIQDSPSLDLVSGMTLEAWVYPTVSGGWRTIIMKETDGDLVYALYQNDLGYPAVWINGTVNAASGTKLARNVWTHIAGTYDGKILRLYVNAVQKKTFATSSDIALSDGKLSIGGNTVWGEYFQGKIDDVRIYNRALSPTEIMRDKNSSADVRTVDFDEPTPYSVQGAPLGLYSQIDFGALDAAWNSPPYAGIVSNYLYSASGNGYFSFSRPEKLISLDVSSVTDGTVILNDDTGQTKTVTVVSGTPVNVIVNWERASSEISWSSSGPLAIDNLVFKKTSSSNQGPNPVSPTVSIAANPVSVIEGNSSSITWSSTHADSCSAAWTTNTDISGTISVTPATSTSYSITCTGTGGSATGSVNVSVIPKPTVSFSANPLTVVQGDSSTLTWNSVHADSCVASWGTSIGISGTASVTPSGTTNYSVTCTGEGGSATADVAVVVTSSTAHTVNLTWDFPPEPTDGTIITGYCLYASNSPGWPYSNPEQKCVDPATNLTSMSFLEGGTKYFIVVTTGTKDGVDVVSGPSNEISTNL